MEAGAKTALAEVNYSFVTIKHAGCRGNINGPTAVRISDPDQHARIPSRLSRASVQAPSVACGYNMNGTPSDANFLRMPPVSSMKRKWSSRAVPILILMHLMLKSALRTSKSIVHDKCRAISVV